MKRLFRKASLIVLVGTLGCTALPVSPFAAERYFAVTPGVWLPGKTIGAVKYDAGWSLGGAAGVSFENGLRLENELVYRQAEAKGVKDDQWVLGWLVNLWWDGKNSSSVTPYFGGGFGYGRGKVAMGEVATAGVVVPVDRVGTGVAYQAGGGFDIRLDRGLSLDLGYRYFGISDGSRGDGVGGFDLAGSSVTAGLHAKF